jgi:hypothetical protein
MYAEAVATKNAYITECNDLKVKLLAVDTARVAGIRNLFLENAKVEDSIKKGLRKDSFSVFDSPAVPPALPQPAPVAKPQPKDTTLSRAAAGRWGWLAGIATFIVIGALIASTGLMQYEVVTVFGVLLAIASGCIVGTQLSDRLSGGHPGGELIFGKNPGQITTALFGMTSLAVLAAIVGTWWWFLTADPNKTGLTPLVSCVATTVGGIFTFAVLGIEAKKICPRCRRLRAAEIVTADMLDRHLETSDVLRADRHYDIRGKPLAKTHRTEPVVTEVTSYAGSRRCKYCDHTWGDIETIRT